MDDDRIVLAGGASTRMRRDKALLPVRGKPMLAHICGQLLHNFNRVLLSLGRRGKYGIRGVRTVVDRTPGEGPMMGIASALNASADELNLVVACDIPDIDMAFARRLLREADGHDAVVAATASGLPEPLFAVYRKSKAPEIDRALSLGERRIRMLFSDWDVALVETPPGMTLANVNTIEEYRCYVDGD